MSGSAAGAAQRLDDNLVEHVIDKAALRSRQALALTCRRFCKLVRSTCSVQLHFNDQDGKPLAGMPDDRSYEEVYHITFEGAGRDEEDGIPNWVRLCGVMTEAVRRWPFVPEITIDPGWYAGDEVSHGMLMGAVVALQHATGLRSLDLDNLGDSRGLMYIALLTQLTSLCLVPGDTASLSVNNDPDPPLFRMTGLRRLEIWAGFHLCLDENADEDDLPLLLPPNLTQLKVIVPSTQRHGGFWRHIAACTGLVELEVLVDDCIREGHPSIMLQQLVGSLKGLRRLVLEGGAWPGSDQMHLNFLTDVVGLLAGSEAAQQQREEHGWDWERTPIMLLSGSRGTHYCAFNDVVLPPPNMGGFTALEELRVDAGTSSGWWLLCSAPHHWHALAACTALRRLEGLHAVRPPPAGVKFPGVTRLVAVTSTHPGDIAGVLRAFPALKQLELVLAPPPADEATAGQQLQQQQQQQGQEQAQQQQQQQSREQAQQQQLLLPQEPGQQRSQRWSALGCSLTRVTLVLHRQGPGLAACFDALWGMLQPIPHLELFWPDGVDLLQQLPPFSAVQGLTSLGLGLRVNPRIKEAAYKQRLPKVPVQALLRVLKGADLLQTLQLWMTVCDDGASNPSSASGGDINSSTSAARSSSSQGSSSSSSSRDRMVLELQQALPALKCLQQGREGEVEPLAAATLAVLRPDLRVGPACC